MPKIDMGQVEELEPLPNAVYDCDVTAAEWIDEEESNSGEPYIKFEFTVSDGEYEGRKLFRNASAQPQALWAMKQLLINVGADKEAVAGEFDTDEILPDVIGNPCRVRTRIKDYEGRAQNEVVRVSPPEGA